MSVDRCVNVCLFRVAVEIQTEKCIELFKFFTARSTWFRAGSAAARPSLVMTTDQQGAGIRRRGRRRRGRCRRRGRSQSFQTLSMRVRNKETRDK